MFFPSKFSYLLLFSDHTYKTKSQTTKSNPLGPIKLSSQSTASVRFCFAFSPASTSCGKMRGKNHSPEPNWHVLTFFHPIFFLHGRVSSTVKLSLASGFFFILCSSSVFLFFPL
jgi:hypothetical protein